MVTAEFILETIIIAVVLTAYTSSVNLRQRKKLKENLGDDCKESVSFYFKHPYLCILTNFAMFLIITSLVKLLHDIIFS
ncbi:MAG: hypothetical protein B6I20_11490 [Bacteroidetes bacterium 4572_117]|nr:MAG: hypothetical protein B6I20_11490 [Bacteroidetes bacterium 4572_117]